MCPSLWYANTTVAVPDIGDVVATGPYLHFVHQAEAELAVLQQHPSTVHRRSVHGTNRNRLLAFSQGNDGGWCELFRSLFQTVRRRNGGQTLRGATEGLDIDPRKEGKRNEGKRLREITKGQMVEWTFEGSP